MKSVIQNKKECFFCHTTEGLEDHHIFFGTANRRLSEFRGLKVWLCNHHHTSGSESVHRNRKADLCLKQMAQFYYEQHIGNRSQFRAEFGKSYLIEE